MECLLCSGPAAFVGYGPLGSGQVGTLIACRSCWERGLNPTHPNSMMFRRLREALGVAVPV